LLAVRTVRLVSWKERQRSFQSRPAKASISRIFASGLATKSSYCTSRIGKRQHPAPMPHQRLVAAIIAGEVPQVVGEADRPVEVGKVAGDCRIPGVAPAMNDPRSGQKQRDQPEQTEVEELLVDDALGRRLVPRRCDRYPSASCSARFLSTSLMQSGKGTSGASIACRPSATCGISTISPAPAARGWLAIICSTSVVPDRGRPRTKIGSSDSLPRIWFSRKKEPVKKAIERAQEVGLRLGMKLDLRPDKRVRPSGEFEGRIIATLALVVAREHEEERNVIFRLPILLRQNRLEPGDVSCPISSPRAIPQDSTGPTQSSDRFASAARNSDAASFALPSWASQAPRLLCASIREGRCSKARR